MKEINISTRSRTQFIDCTRHIKASIEEWGLESGIVTAYVPHTTAGITINENADPDVMADLEDALEGLAPWRSGYKHAEGNAAAHIKASLMGSSVQLVVADGRIRTGTWQGVYFCEFDGPRQRKLWIARN